MNQKDINLTENYLRILEVGKMSAILFPGEEKNAKKINGSKIQTKYK